MRQIKVNKEAFTPRKTRAAAIYLNEVDRTPMISPEKEAEFGYLALQGDQNAKDQLIKANMRFVLTVAKNYARNPEDFAEIVAAGNVGLVYAASYFDPSRGFKFISFAVWHIRKEILKHLGDCGRLVRLPGNQINVMKAMAEAGNEISMTEGREPEFDEMLERIKEKNPDRFSRIRTENVEFALKADVKPASLDKPIGVDNDSSTLMDLMNIGSIDADLDLTILDNGGIIDNLVNVLTSIETEIVFRKHGIEPFSEGEENFTEIAKNMGMNDCGENARTKYISAIKKLKKQADKMNYKITDVF
jgi:RNA polymerase primary sigma factor